MNNSEARRQSADRATGEKIEKARRQKGWTQTQLGEKIGLTQQGVSRLESGHSASWSIVVLVAKVTGKPLDFFR